MDGVVASLLAMTVDVFALRDSLRHCSESCLPTTISAPHPGPRRRLDAERLVHVTERAPLRNAGGRVLWIAWSLNLQVRSGNMAFDHAHPNARFLVQSTSHRLCA